MKYKTMSSLYNFQTKQDDDMKSLHDDTHLVIRLNHLWVLKLMAQAAILALVIVSFLWITTIIRGSTSSYGYHSVPKVEMTYHSPIKGYLPLVFHDLANEGLLRTGDRSLLITNGNEETIYDSQVTRDYNNMDLISFSDLARQESLILEEIFDFIFTYASFSKSLNFIDRSVKVGGIIVVQFRDNPMAKFPQPSNYKIVYVRKFDSTNIIAIRKTRTFTSTTFDTATHHRKLLDLGLDARKAALKNLEDVLLEPPRAASGKSSRYLKRTRYLPELMNIPLENYPRRVFIEATDDSSSWFSKYYPTRNTKFEIFKINAVTNKESSSEKEFNTPLIGMSDWLKKNVKENEYVVMKAEAEVVEEMVKNKATKLVDELFLECKHQGVKKVDRKSRRGYWECLSLYGMLRDEGVAVHQWWG